MSKATSPCVLMPGNGTWCQAGHVQLSRHLQYWHEDTQEINCLAKTSTFWLQSVPLT